MDWPPTTAYLLQSSEGGCAGTCAFCPQSSSAGGGGDLLSRIRWPEVELRELVEGMRSSRLVRICVQTIIKEGFEREVIDILREIRGAGIDLPASVATTPVDVDLLREMRRLGVTHLGVGMDAATPEIAEAVGKPFRWEDYLRFAEEALEVFGPGSVFVHLIFGLGESEREFADAMIYLYSRGLQVALFAFTPVRGTPMWGRPSPDLAGYRRMQRLRYALSAGVPPGEAREMYERGRLPEDRRALLTSGCPGCNRPFYNESPSGPIYNYPAAEAIPP